MRNYVYYVYYELSYFFLIVTARIQGFWPLDLPDFQCNFPLFYWYYSLQCSSIFTVKTIYCRL